MEGGLEMGVQGGDEEGGGCGALGIRRKVGGAVVEDVKETWKSRGVVY